MQVIIAGCGKVGYTIARNLAAEENVHLTIIDVNNEALDKASETIDALLIRGNSLNTDTLIEAGAKDATLMISVTDADETNILCCILAKRLGTEHTIARVRSPEYTMDLNNFWKSLGLDMIINPENEAAREISRLLRFPAVDDIDTFLGGRVELVSFKVSEAAAYFVGKSVMEIFSKKRYNILLALVERDNEAIIPTGSLVFEEGDVIRVLGRPEDIMGFFALIGKNTGRIKSATIIGGSKVTHYLVTLLQRHSSGTAIRIVEISKKRCELLSERFPKSLIINGDGTDEDILSSEVINQTEAIVCLTDRDEENAIIALYSQDHFFRKIIIKIDHINPNLVKNLGIGSIVSPKNLTSEQIVRYVRGLSNAAGSSVRTLYNLFSNEEDRVEAVEFIISDDLKCINKQLKELKLKKGVLIACIVRNQDIIIPMGDTEIRADDVVIIIAKNQSLSEPDDILAGITGAFTEAFSEAFVLNSRRLR